MNTILTMHRLPAFSSADETDDLAERAQAGDRRAADELVCRTYGALISKVAGLLKVSAEWADDVLSGVVAWCYPAALRHWRRGAGANFLSFLLGMSWFKARQELASLRGWARNSVHLHRRMLPLDGQEDQERDQQPEPEPVDPLVVLDLERMLARLDERRRQIIVRRLAGDGFAEIGRDLKLAMERVRQVEAESVRVMRGELPLPSRRRASGQQVSERMSLWVSRPDLKAAEAALLWNVSQRAAWNWMRDNRARLAQALAAPTPSPRRAA